MKTKAIKKLNFIVLTILLLSFSACNRAYKMIEEGRYDSALELEIKKLSGKKNKNPKHVAYLEKAFKKANDVDMHRIKALRAEKNRENWVDILHIVKRIGKRQDMVSPFLPLIDKKGYQAEFRFVKVEQLELEAKEQTVEYFYDHGKELLVRAKRGDKDAARDAYHELSKIKHYFDSYRDKAQLMAEALSIGQTRILFKMENDANIILPTQFEKELMRIGAADLSSLWNKVYIKDVSDVEFDYNIVMRLNDIDVSPETIREKEYIDEEEIRDGWIYQLDKNGNVRKDTLGNDIKDPRFVIIRAAVLESFQTKYAKVGGRLEYVDNENGNMIRTEPIKVEVAFEHYASTYSGDRRALCQRSLRNIGNRPIPFPSDENLILQAAESLKPIVVEKLKHSRLL